MVPNRRNWERRSLFRASAMERYVQSREVVVLPALVRPRAFAFLWLLLAFLTVGGWFVWSIRFPIFASSSAIVTKPLGSEDVILVALFPPSYLSSLKVGRTVFFTSSDTEERIGQPIMAVERNILSPAVIVQRFGISLGAATEVRQPAAVITARFEPRTRDPLTYLGSIYQAEVEVGTRRVISLLPVVGKFFGAA